MAGFVAGLDRGQTTLLPECLEDWVDENNSVRAVDVFVEALDLRDLGFEGVDAAGIGRPSYRPGVLLKLYIYGYLNRVQSSRRLEREAGRNLEVMWLTGRLAPDHKTIADFRRDNGPAIKKVCAQFVELCRKMGLLAKASVAVDGSKFKAVNSRDNNFTEGKIRQHRSMIGGRGPLQEHKVKITEEHIKLLRKKAVAALLGVDPYTVTLWVKKGTSTVRRPTRC